MTTSTKKDYWEGMEEKTDISLTVHLLLPVICYMYIDFFPQWKEKPSQPKEQQVTKTTMEGMETDLKAAYVRQYRSSKQELWQSG